MPLVRVFSYLLLHRFDICDVKNLNKSNINIGIDGVRWLCTKRQKTKAARRVPLLLLAKELINKNANNPQRNLALKINNFKYHSNGSG